MGNQTSKTVSKTLNTNYIDEVPAMGVCSHNPLDPYKVKAAILIHVEPLQTGGSRLAKKDSFRITVSTYLSAPPNEVYRATYKIKGLPVASAG